MKDFFKKTSGKVVIIAAVCVCVLVVFLVKNTQSAPAAGAAAAGAVIEQLKQQALESEATATQTPPPILKEQEAEQTEPAAEPTLPPAETTPAETQPADEPAADAQSEPKEALPIFMVFGADWCPYCEQMEPTIEELKNEYEGRLQFVDINIDDDPQTAEAFGASAVPYYVLIDAEGKPALAFPGATTKEKLQDFIREGVGIEP